MTSRFGLQREPIDERIALASKERERLKSELSHKQEEMENWGKYLKWLQEISKMEDVLDGRVINNDVPLTQEERDTRSITKLLVYFTYNQRNHEIVNGAAALWAVNQQLYSTERDAKVGINSLVGHRFDLWSRVNRGIYRLTPKGKEVGSLLTAQFEKQHGSHNKSNGVRSE